MSDARATYPLDVIAKLLDLTPRRVQQLSGEGVIPRAERGRYDLVGAVRGYIRYLRDRAAAGDTGADDYGKHRARLTKARADMAEMEREQLSKELIPADDIEGAWTAATAMMRSRFLSIPSKLAPRMVSIKDANAARDLIETAIHDALKELASVTIEVVAPLRASDASPDPDLADEGLGAASEADDL